MIAEIIFVLAPATLMMFAAIIISLSTLSKIILGNAKFPTIEILMMYFVIAIIQILASYGLYSLWWLVLNHAKISIKQIPRYIWCGLITGTAINVIILAGIFVTLFPMLALPSGKLPFSFSTAFISSIGLLILLLALISLIWMQDKWGGLNSSGKLGE